MTQFQEIQRAKENLIKALWHGGFEFITCWNLGGKGKLSKLLDQNQVVLTKDGEEVEVRKVIKLVIESKEIKGYAIVVLAPGSLYYGGDEEEQAFITEKTKQLMNIFNLAPVKVKIHTPLPFGRDRGKEVIKKVETVDEVIRLIRMG